jgi:hypothetical protein
VRGADGSASEGTGRGPRPLRRARFAARHTGEGWGDREEGIPISIVESPSHDGRREHRHEAENGQSRARPSRHDAAERQRGHERHEERERGLPDPFRGPGHSHRAKLAEAQRGHGAVRGDGGKGGARHAHSRHEGQAQREVGRDAEGRVHQVESRPPQEQHVLGEPGVAADGMRDDEQAHEQSRTLEAGTEEREPERRPERQRGGDAEQGRQHPAYDVAESRALLLATPPTLGGREGVQEGGLGGETHLPREACDLGGGAVDSQHREVEAGRPAHECRQDQHVQPLHREVDQAGGGREHREWHESRCVRLAGSGTPLLAEAASKPAAREQVGGAGRSSEAQDRCDRGRAARPDDSWQPQPHEGHERSDLREAVEQAAGHSIVLHDAQAARGSVRDPIEGDRGQGQQHRALSDYQIGRLRRVLEPGEHEPGDARNDRARTQSRRQGETEDRARARCVSLSPATGHESSRPLVEPEGAHLAQQVGRRPGHEKAAESRLSEQASDEQREEHTETAHPDREDVRDDAAQQCRSGNRRPRSLAGTIRQPRPGPQVARHRFAHRRSSPLTSPNAHLPFSSTAVATRNLPKFASAQATWRAAVAASQTGNRTNAAVGWPAAQPKAMIQT